MAIMRVNIFGRDLHDKLVVKLLIGGICFIILLATLGGSALWDWIIEVFIIWIAALLFFIPITYGFIYENFSYRYIAMILIGGIMLFLYCIYSHQPALTIVSSVIKALVSMTLFSIILDQVKDKLDR